MWWAKLILLLVITTALTTLIVWGRSWIYRNKEQHPEIFKNRGVIGAVVWLILNSSGS